MARQSNITLTNNFSGGYVTENTSLNYPENSVTETSNVTYDSKGNVYRRSGIDYEGDFSTKTENRTGGVVSNYLWKNVAGEGDLSLLVQQVGNILYFYEATASDTLSTNAITDNIDLTDFSTAGAPDPQTIACQFSTGLGYLFVTHPYLESFYVEYDLVTETFTTTEISLKIRDFEGVEDLMDLTERSTTLSDAHKYNLLNQGWTTNGQTYTSSQIVAISLNPHLSATTSAFTIASGQTISAGETLTAICRYAPHVSITGTVVSYSGTTLTINNNETTGGTAAAVNYNQWIIGREAPYLQLWNINLGTYPSNADVWWHFKDSSDAFKPSLSLHSPVLNTPAPNGRFIVNAYDIDRDTLTGLSGLTTTTSGFQRASTCAFFAGRIFYSGVNSVGYNSQIFFSQILEDIEQVGECYQRNDPTSEDLFDLLPSDGGVIDIQDAGTIIKLISLKEGLLVFATNGVWFITGSTGLGFTATDYVVQKISHTAATTSTSFVDVLGVPMWWNNEGIYTISSGQSGGMGVQNLSDEKIKEFFITIPISSRREAKGAYNALTKTVQWIYRAQESGTIEETQEYDSILIFDTKTGAFYKWTISDSDTKINSIFVVDSTGGNVSVNQVIDDSLDTVVDDAGNNVVVFDLESGAAQPIFKYTCSYLDGSTYAFTFAEERDTDYVDWASTGTSVDYTSYFITGYKLSGQTQRKFQSNYVYLFSDGSEDTQFYFQGIRNFTTSPNTGKWGSQQLIINEPSDQGTIVKRIKLRGHGLALQYRVESLPGEPFNIVGWSTWETINQGV